MNYKVPEYLDCFIIHVYKHGGFRDYGISEF